jgi:hypothetical protein
MPDMTTLLSQFLNRLYNGTYGDTIASTKGLADGTGVAPSIAFASEPTLGIYRSQAGVINVTGGALVCASSITSGGNMFPALTSSVIWGATRNRLNAPADGQMNLTNLAQTAGFGFDCLTDAVLKVRTRAQTGYATVDALGYRASGAAGVSFGPAAVASITVVNGIVTAIS